jgi:dTDP-4-amino-4,6-dideoxygalactose transaminase
VVIPWWWNSVPDSSKFLANQALKMNAFTMGENVRLFENELSKSLGIPDIILTNSGTSALMISLLLADIKPGDEVIVPALTWIATAQAAKILGADVKVVDVNADTKCLDTRSFESAISEKTKAVIPVFFNGRSPAIDEISDIARKHGIKVIEDRCKALGTSFSRQFKSSDVFAQAFSLGMISYISIGYGGFVGVENSEIAKRARLIRDHGMQRQPERYQEMGSNFKVSDILASIGLPQVGLLSERVEHTLKLQEIYHSNLSGKNGLLLDHFSQPAGDIATYIELILDKDIDSQKFVLDCREKGVEVMPYHKPINQALYLSSQDCKNSDMFEGRIIAVPSGPGTLLDRAEFCAKVIKGISLGLKQ